MNTHIIKIIKNEFGLKVFYEFIRQLVCQKIDFVYKENDKDFILYFKTCYKVKIEVNFAKKA